jgi:hypothetical protein
MKRNEIEIRVWMTRNGVRVTDIQKALGMKQSIQVTQTLQGLRNDRRVLRWLRDNNCPVELLALPEDMAEAA